MRILICDRNLRALSPRKANGMGHAGNPHLPLEAVRVFEAAAELGVTQSAVSQRVKGLEASLGVAPFDRSPHGLRLLEAGEWLQAEVSA